MQVSAGSLRGADNKGLADSNAAFDAVAPGAAILKDQAIPWETGRALGLCDKCNIAVCLGGCKCDTNCACKPGLGGEMQQPNESCLRHEHFL
jgi:hypothetical protein